MLEMNVLKNQNKFVPDIVINVGNKKVITNKYTKLENLYSYSFFKRFYNILLVLFISFAVYKIFNTQNYFLFLAIFLLFTSFEFFSVYKENISKKIRICIKVVKYITFFIIFGFYIAITGWYVSNFEHKKLQDQLNGNVAFCSILVVWVWKLNFLISQFYFYGDFEEEKLSKFFFITHFIFYLLTFSSLIIILPNSLIFKLCFVLLMFITSVIYYFVFYINNKIQRNINDNYNNFNEYLIINLSNYLLFRIFFENLYLKMNENLSVFNPILNIWMIFKQHSELY